MTMQEWAENILTWAEEKGWNEINKTRSQGEWAALAHSEITEAFEEYRNGHDPREIYYSIDKQGRDKPEGMAVEYADLLIRVLHWFAWHGLNPDALVDLKMRYNQGRPYQHGGKLA